MGAEPTPLPTPGIWIGASRVHGRPVRVDEDYPHICHHITSWQGRRFPIGAKSCAACGEEAAEKT